VQENYFVNFGEAMTDELSPPIGERLEELESERYYAEVCHDGRGLCVPHDLDDLICRYQDLRPPLQAKFDRATYWLSMARRQWEDSMSASYASLVSAAEALTTEQSSQHKVYCEQCKEIRSHDVPGATEKFRAFFEKYAPGSGLRERRSKMYGLRSKIVHGSDLMQLDQGRALGCWDPPWRNEEETNKELWTLMRIAARNWLRDPPTERA
jgi:Apea-like HEPN